MGPGTLTEAAQSPSTADRQDRGAGTLGGRAPKLGVPKLGGGAPKLGVPKLGGGAPALGGGGGATLSGERDGIDGAAGGGAAGRLMVGGAGGGTGPRLLKGGGAGGIPRGSGVAAEGAFLTPPWR